MCTQDGVDEEDIDEEDEGDTETYEADENYENLNLNATPDLNWTLDSLGNKNDSGSEFLFSPTVESFCNSAIPSPLQYSALKGDGNIEAFRKHLQSLPDNEYLLNAVFTALKIAAIAKSQPKAMSIACDLLKDCYEHAVKTNQVF